MKRLLALVVLAASFAVPSWASDVVGHSVAVAGKDTAKVATVTAKDSTKVVTATAKDSAKAVAKVGRFLF